jgi:hypothetical protein
MTAEKRIYRVPMLLDGYLIAKAGPHEYYLQQRLPDGTWWNVRGPYKQSNSAMAWLRNYRFRMLMEARKRGDVIIWPDVGALILEGPQAETPRRMTP